MVRHAIMDGSPVRNETVPVRLFLKPYDITPSYESVNNQFSVKYYINLVLEDTEKNRFFKQKEVIFYRIKKQRNMNVGGGLLSNNDMSDSSVDENKTEENKENKLDENRLDEDNVF